jgi:hypothetical protein
MSVLSHIASIRSWFLGGKGFPTRKRPEKALYFSGNE